MRVPQAMLQEPRPSRRLAAQDRSEPRLRAKVSEADRRDAASLRLRMQLEILRSEGTFQPGTASAATD